MNETRKDIPNMRKPKPIKIEFTDEKEEIELEKQDLKVPIWRRPGFKRTSGIVIMGLGVVIGFFNSTVGKVLEYGGGLLSGIGVLDAGNKKKKEENMDWKTFILQIFKELIKILKRK